MSVVRALHGQKPRFYSPSVVVDGAANRYTARISNEGTEANTVIIVTKVTPVGVRQDIATIRSEIGKFDDCVAAQTGPHLLVVATSHVGDPDTYEQEFILLNVCVPYPDGVRPFGKAGAFLPDVEPPPPPPSVDVDYARIAREVKDAVMSQIRSDFGGNIRAGLYDKAKDAIRDSQVLTNLNVHDSDGLYARLSEILYEFGLRREQPIEAEEQPQP